MTVHTRHLPPAASALMEAIRGVGYDPRTAVADIIDNSLAASAEDVWVRFHWNLDSPTVTILDDGAGMSEEVLDRAMTLGSVHPQRRRATTDLGRFGLGLKTASLSQCSRLVVATREAGGAIHKRAWDLKRIDQTNEWLVELDCNPHEQEQYLPLLDALSSGTLVIWSSLERMLGTERAADSGRGHFQQIAAEVERHLAMTFHRMLEGPQPRFRLYLNGASDEFRVRPWDPFYRSNPATQVLPKARRDGVELSGYVLPHKDRIQQKDYDVVGGPDGWLGQQGFYIYRLERLVVAGSWLGLGDDKRWGRDEQHKLARIQLDMTNDQDTLWSLDVKKSRATPPPHLKSWLVKQAARVREKARDVYVHRGKHVSSEQAATFSPIWQPGHGAAPTYRINRNHPAVEAVTAAGGAAARRLESMLRLLEATVPVHRIWLDVSAKPETPPPAKDQLDEDEVRRIAEDLVQRMETGMHLTHKAAIARLRSVEPFNHFPHILAALES